MVGIRTRKEVNGMIPDNSKRPDVVYTSDTGHEIIARVLPCSHVGHHQQLRPHGGGTGLVGGEVGFHWKESNRQEWAGPDWKSRSG